MAKGMYMERKRERELAAMSQAARRRAPQRAAAVPQPRPKPQATAAVTTVPGPKPAAAAVAVPIPRPKPSTVKSAEPFPVAAGPQAPATVQVAGTAAASQRPMDLRTRKSTPWPAVTPDETGVLVRGAASGTARKKKRRLGLMGHM